MKNFLILLLCIAVQKSYGQMYESKVDYNRTKQAAVVSEYNYPEQIVEKTLRDKFERLGYKIRSSRGFLVISNATLSDISTKPMEYAFKVDRKSRREKDVAVLSAIMIENGVNATAENTAGLKSFLTDLVPSIEAVNLDFMVNEQFNAVVKSQKKLKNLQDDQSSMERKVRNLQDDLKKNAREQDDLQKEITKQQEVLDGFKAKKTGTGN
jgi:gas vesicle protein